VTTTIVARVDTTGTRVLCGRPGCGFDLARIGWFGKYAMADDGTTIVKHCIVYFSAGWRQDGHGVWTLTNHARRQLAADRRLASGGVSAPRHLAEEARARLSSGRSIGDRRSPAALRAARATPGLHVSTQGDANGGLSTDQGRSAVTLPALARCDCTGINLLGDEIAAALTVPIG